MQQNQQNQMWSLLQERKKERWVHHWLINSTQRVNIDGPTSSWKVVISGTKQGSILSPKLFNVFINDLDNEIDELFIRFADDIKLGCLIYI